MPQEYGAGSGKVPRKVWGDDFLRARQIWPAHLSFAKVGHPGPASIQSHKSNCRSLDFARDDKGGIWDDKERVFSPVFEGMDMGHPEFYGAAEMGFSFPP
uniref:Uncharacterized protein n=1 Tax=Paracidobacterium acidisoli TaxID=2303751 RepID=A0A372ISU8_9BACT